MKNSIASNKNMRTIGLILEDVFSEFAQEIIQSISLTIRDSKDLRLVVVAGRQDDIAPVSDDPMHQYKRMYNLVYNMHRMFRFDGLLLTFPNFSRMQRDLYRDIPKVYLASDLEDELTANYDSEPGIREAVDYLVKIKNMTNFCMLGGRDDNSDAQKRKRIFQQCLKDNGLTFSESQYEKADMSTATQDAAARLLARNPDVQVIFCVNDATASGLYDVMLAKDLKPGEDIMVFGFDNAFIAEDLNPPLASIGSDGLTLGQKALEMILDKMDGQEVSSQVVPTRLYGRESFEYEMFEFSAKEMLNANSSFIYRFFDNCFYRYRNEVVTSGALDLRRLFYEILSRMLRAQKNRYMSDDEYLEIAHLIDILFENGIMMYTDPNRFVRSIFMLQYGMNEVQNTGFVNTKYNRLFSKMKDRAILFHGTQKRAISRNYNIWRNRVFDFMIWTTNYGKPGEDALKNLICRFDRIGLNNAALFLYRQPFCFREEEGDHLPDLMYLRCVIRNGELYEIPEERQECSIEDIYNRNELPSGRTGYISYPLFCGSYVFGMLVSSIDRDIFLIGEFVASQLGRAIFTNWVCPDPDEE